MPGFQQWVKKCFDNLVDPDKDGEVAALTALLHKSLVTLKKDFVLFQVLNERQYKQVHLDIATQQVYRHFLVKAWKDGKVDPSELDTLKWIASSLQLSGKTARELNIAFARSQFAEALAEAMEDGVISRAESSELHGIARAADMSLAQFVHSFFKSEGESFLQGIFAAAIADNVEPMAALSRLTYTASELGISRDDLLSAIEPQATRIIEHTLADAKEDGVIDDDEEQLLNQLLANFSFERGVREYVVDEIAILKQLAAIRQGRLPTLDCPTGLNLKSGELLHFFDQAKWEVVKYLKNGPSTTLHAGDVAITDSRIMFSSPSKSESIAYSSIVAHDSWHGAIQIQVRNKPSGRFFCANNPHLLSAIFSSAVSMANQTLVRQDAKGQSRHIPRDVRQRAWQKYSGRCADCGDTSYLEFDHIVPVAKGGSNSDANVQLLCRKCNLQKSDMI